MSRRCFLSLIVITLLLSGCASTKEETYPLPSPTPDREETLRLLRESYEQTKESTPIVYNYAYALTFEGEYNEALSVVNSYLETHNDSLRFLSLKAYIEKAALRYGEYEKTLRAIIALDEANVPALESLINYLSVTRRDEEARSLARTILYYEPTNQTAVKVLAGTIPFYQTLIEENEEVYERRAEAGLRRPEADFTFSPSADEFIRISPSLL